MKIREVSWEDFVKIFPSAVKSEDATYFYGEHHNVGFMRDNTTNGIATFAKDTDKLSAIEFSAQDDFDILLALAPKLRGKTDDEVLDEHQDITEDDMYEGDVIDESYSYQGNIEANKSFRAKVKKFAVKASVVIGVLLFASIVVWSAYAMRMIR